MQKGPQKVLYPLPGCVRVKGGLKGRGRLLQNFGTLGVSTMEKALLPEETPPREVLCGRFRFRTPLRCDGVGKLDCVEDLYSGQRKVVRWLPLEVNRQEEQNIVQFCVNLPMHPSLPEVCEFGEMESWAYMVVDFPEGDLLSARQTFLPPQVWQRMAYQLSGALSALHAAQVFHGELCMPSVMLLEEEALLWDLPLVLCSRMADRRQEVRVLQQLMRTASTLAPERARGGPLGPEGDVYSLGALLAYSAGSRQPQAEATLALVHAIASGQFKPDIPRALPLACRNMLACMLAPRAKDRPRIGEVAAFFAATSVPAPGIPVVHTPLLFPASGLAQGPRPPAGPPPLPPAAFSPPPSPSPTVSGVDWMQMLSSQEEAKTQKKKKG